jgi:hypothetical protein
MSDVTTAAAVEIGHRWEVLGTAGGRVYGLVGGLDESTWFPMVSTDGQTFTGMHAELGRYDWPSRDEAVAALTAYLGQSDAKLQPIPPTKSNKSNRKTAQRAPGANFYAPNLLNDGTRKLGALVAGTGVWEIDSNLHAYVGTVRGARVGRIVFRSDTERAEVNHLTALLSPRTLQTLVAISTLLYERTRGQPLNQVARLTVREIADASRYTPTKNRTIDPEILRRIGADLRALTRIETFAADGAYDPKRKRAPSGWVAPLLVISAVHIGQEGMFEGEPLPYEFDAMLGRNWAAAVKERFDVVQIAPGFMELDPGPREEQAIKLAWFYLTDFRYQMKSPKPTRTFQIAPLCGSANITPEKANLGRFLGRLEGWHARLHELGIIGAYRRNPAFDSAKGAAGSDEAPREIFERGTYTVTPPAAILEAYAGGAAKGLEPPKRRP